MKKLTAYETALLASLFALTVILGPVPFVFLLPLSFACATRGFKTGVTLGLMFGLYSLALSYAGGSPVSVAFMQAPYIPVVARVLCAVLTCLFSEGIKKIWGDKTRTRFVLRVALTGAVASLLNSGLVIGSILLFLPGFLPGEALSLILTVSAPIELAVNVLLLPPICLAVKKLEDAMPRRRGMKKRAAEDNTGTDAAEPVSAAQPQTEEHHDISH